MTQAFLTEQRERTNAALADLAAQLPDNAVGNAMRYALAGDGKRLRPALCVACYRALRGDHHPSSHRLAASREIICAT